MMGIRIFRYDGEEYVDQTLDCRSEAYARAVDKMCYPHDFPSLNLTSGLRDELVECSSCLSAEFADFQAEQYCKETDTWANDGDLEPVPFSAQDMDKVLELLTR